MRKHRGLLVGIGLCLATALLGGAAFAAQWTTKNDPDDTAGPLDIKKAQILVPKGTVFGPGDPVKCRTVFFESPVFDSEGDEVHCYFDTKGDQNADVWAITKYGSLGPVTTLSRFTPQGIQNRDANFTVEGNSIVVTIPRKWLRGREGFLRWYRQAYSVDSGECSSECQDLVPLRKYTYD